MVIARAMSSCESPTFVIAVLCSVEAAIALAMGVTYEITETEVRTLMLCLLPLHGVFERVVN